MKKIALGALFAGLLVACGGGKSTPDAPIVVTIDAPVVGACNPVAQSGCQPTEKCTWVRTIAGSADQRGQLGCVAAGTKALHDACTWGAAGTATGYDDCGAGLICLASSKTDMASGTCSAICDSSAAIGAAGSCATNYACGLYTNFFSNAGDTANSTGLCDPTCHPLTQVRDYDSAADCGGTIDATSHESTRGCYGLPSSDTNPSQFTCSSNFHNGSYGSDAIAYDPVEGGAFLNGCDPGYIPLLYKDTAAAVAKDAMNVICVAYCQPDVVSSESTANANGDPAHTCAAAGAGAPHECRHWWFLEGGNGVATPKSEFSDGLGYCFKYTNYQYDSNKDMKIDNTDDIEPSCTILSSTKMTFDPPPAGMQSVPDNVYWGCGANPNPFAKGNLQGTRADSRLRPLLTPAQMKTLRKTFN